MALRLFTPEEFFNALEQLGLERTEHETDTSQAWHSPSGDHILIPKSGVEIPDQGERFPDNWLAEVYIELEKLENNDG